LGSGSPSLSPAQGRAKTSPLRDVAVMLRSLAHAVAVAKAISPSSSRRDARGRKAPRGICLIFSNLIQAYMEGARDSPIWIEDERTRRHLLVLYLLAELLHEIETERKRTLTGSIRQSTRHGDPRSHGTGIMKSQNCAAKGRFPIAK